MSVALIKKIKKIDYLLVITLVLISILGIAMVISADNSYTQAKIIQVMLGFIVFALASATPTLWYGKVALLGYVVTLILLILVDLSGDISKGAQRWLNLGFIRFQPSEIAKITTPLMVAHYLGNRPLPPSIKDTSIAFCLALIPSALVMTQPDLGTAILTLASGLIIIFLAGLSWKIIGAGVILLAAMMPLSWIYLLHDYQKGRILTLFDPERDPLGAGYHIIQSKIAIGSGGLYGKGYLLGTQSQLEFLPEPHTDFIFAVLSEEFGLIGIIILLTLYLIIIIRGIAIGIQSRTNFGRLIAGGTTLLFFVYIFVNIAMVSGLMPVVGVPLPLISYGGTSFVALMASMGMVMSVKIYQSLGKNYNPYR